MKKYLGILGVGVVLLLSGCSSLEGMFADDTEPPLKGERISILQLQKELTPDAALAGTPLQIPDVWANESWPQAGGLPNHAMGQLALGPSLKKAWSASIGKGDDKRALLTAAPVVGDGRVYAIDTTARVSAFSAKDGKKIWDHSATPSGDDGSGALGGGIAYADGRIFVTAGYKAVTALDAATGKKIWNIDTPSPGRAAPTVLDGRVFVVTMDNRLLVYSADDGHLLWDYTGVSETTNMLGSASVAGDGTLVVLPLSSGDLFGFNAADGKVLWQDSLSAVRRAGALSSIADIRGLPVIDRGLILAVSYSGRIVALDQFSGQRVWQRELGSGQTPWAAGNGVYLISSDQQLVGINRDTGAIHWVATLTRHAKDDKDKTVVWSGPVLAGGRLILLSSDGDMIEVDPATGKILKTTEFKEGSIIAPIVSNNTLFILTKEGDLIAYR